MEERARLERLHRSERLELERVHADAEECVARIAHHDQALSGLEQRLGEVGVVGDAHAQCCVVDDKVRRTDARVALAQMPRHLADLVVAHADRHVVFEYSTHGGQRLSVDESLKCQRRRPIAPSACRCWRRAPAAGARATARSDPPTDRR